MTIRETMTEDSGSIFVIPMKNQETWPSRIVKIILSSFF